MLELFVGWRYLYRGGRKPALLGLLAVSVVLLVAGVAIFWRAPHSGVYGVFMLALGALGVIVFGLMAMFSIFTTVSIVGVVLGVAALSIVLSVTSGFQAQFQQKVLGVNAHVLVMRGPGMVDWEVIEELAREDKRVKATEPFTMNELLVTRGTGGGLSAVAMKGVDPARVTQVLDVAQHLEPGSEGALEKLGAARGQDDNPPILIGRGLQQKLKAVVGDDVTVVSPDIQSYQVSGGRPRTQKFRVVGIFYSGFDEYDRRLMYVNIKDAQEFLQKNGEVLGVEMRLDDIEAAASVAKKLEAKLPPDYSVVDWRHLNRNLFTALKLQKVVLLLFLTLIIVVAAFNIVAALTLIVFDKTKEIAILKSMGASAGAVGRVFAVVGMTIGVVGTALGLGLGVLLCKVVAKYGYPLDPKVYLIDRLPVRIDPVEFGLTALITLAVCGLATLVPSRRASALKPVEGLRYE